VADLEEATVPELFAADEELAPCTGANPIPDISNSGTSRTTVVLTAFSMRSPCASPGLVKAWEDDGLKDMEGGCITAKFLTGYGSFTCNLVEPL